jgi:hypothetical protein
MITFRRDGDDFVYYYHTVRGAEECCRVPAGEATDCVGWYVSVIGTVFSIIFALINLGFTAYGLSKWLTSFILGMQSRIGLLQGLMAQKINPEWIVKALRVLYAMGGISSAVANSIIGVNWWRLAFVIANAAITIAGIVLSGGAYLAVWVLQLGYNIAQLIVVINQRPKGC